MMINEAESDIIVQEILNTLVSAFEIYVKSDSSANSKFNSIRAQQFYDTDPIIFNPKIFKDTETGKLFALPTVLFITDREYKPNITGVKDPRGQYLESLDGFSKIADMMAKQNTKPTWTGVIVIYEQQKLRIPNITKFSDIFKTKIKSTIKHELLHYVQMIQKKIKSDSLSMNIEKYSDYIIYMLNAASDIIYDDTENDIEDPYEKYMLKDKEIDARFHQEITAFLLTHKVDLSNLEKSAEKFVSTYIYDIGKLPETIKQSIFDRVLFILQRCKKLGLFDKVLDEDGDETIKIKEIYRKKGESVLWKIIKGK